MPVSLHKSNFNDIVNATALHTCSLNDRKGISNTLLSDIAAKDNGPFLFSLEFAKAALAYVVCGIDLWMPEEVKVFILEFTHSFLGRKAIRGVF